MKFDVLKKIGQMKAKRDLLDEIAEVGDMAKAKGFWDSSIRPKIEDATRCMYNKEFEKFNQVAKDSSVIYMIALSEIADNARSEFGSSHDTSSRVLQSYFREESNFELVERVMKDVRDRRYSPFEIQQKSVKLNDIIKKIYW